MEDNVTIVRPIINATTEFAWWAGTSSNALFAGEVESGEGIRVADRDAVTDVDIPSMLSRQKSRIVSERTYVLACTSGGGLG